MARKPSHFGSYSQPPSLGSESTDLASIGSIGTGIASPAAAVATGAASDVAVDADGAEARRVAMSSLSVSMRSPPVAFDSHPGSSPVWCRQGNGHAIIAGAMASTPIAIDPATRRTATTWVGRGLLFVATVFLLEHARPLLLPIAIAIVFTFVLAAPVRALQRVGIHEYIGSALVIVAVLGVAVVLLMLVAAPAAAWWARAPLIVHDLVEALQGWRDALFPYAPPASLARAPSAPSA